MPALQFIASGNTHEVGLSRSIDAAGDHPKGKRASNGHICLNDRTCRLIGFSFANKGAIKFDFVECEVAQESIGREAASKFGQDKPDAE